jgi:uncharacterized protein
MLADREGGPYMIKVNLSSVTHAKSGFQYHTELDLGQLLIKDLDLAYLKGHLCFTRVADGILVQGSLTTEVKTECTRCLTSYYAPITIDLEDIISLPGVALTQERPVRVTENGWVDLAPLVREYAWLELPRIALCSPDCQGICIQCGGNINLGECTCKEVDKIDPRWEILRALMDRPENA